MKQLELVQMENLQGGTNSGYVAGCVLGVGGGIIAAAGLLASAAGGPMTMLLYASAIATGLDLGAGLGSCYLMLK